MSGGAAAGQVRLVPSAAGGRARPGRLRKKSEFAQVFERPDRVLNGRYFKVLARRGAASAPRLGLAISRKHTRTNVRRNLLKRLARESFRMHVDRLPPWDVVVLSRAGAREADRKALRAELERLWSLLEQGE